MAGTAGTGRRFSAGAGFRHALQIALPHFILIETEVIQQIPGIKPGVMAVSKIKLYGIITDRFDFGDVDHFLAGLQYFLPRTMAAYFGRWRMNAQKLAWKLKSFTVGESDVEHSGFCVQLNFGRIRCIFG